MSHWDSSALVKLYTKEADSILFERFAASASSIPVTSRLAFYEIQTALWRKESEGTLLAGTAQTSSQRLMQDAAAGQLRVIEFSAEVEREFRNVLVRCYRQVPPFCVRTLDAIHLASTLVAGETEFVTSDLRLRHAAQFLGLKLFPGPAI